MNRTLKRHISAKLIREPPTLEMIQGREQCNCFYCFTLIVLVIYIRTLTPSSWEEMHGKQFVKAAGAPAEIRKFYEMDSLNVFVANKQFKKEENIKAHNIWVMKTFFVTKETMPAVQRLSEVIHIEEVKLTSKHQC